MKTKYNIFCLNIKKEFRFFVSIYVYIKYFFLLSIISSKYLLKQNNKFSMFYVCVYKFIVYKHNFNNVKLFFFSILLLLFQMSFLIFSIYFESNHSFLIDLILC
jgi:hypothetical protein